MYIQLNSSSEIQTLVRPIAKTSTFSEDSRVDTKGFSDAIVIFDVGAISGTSPTLSLQIEAGTGSDGSGASNVSNAVVASWTANVPQVGHINLRNLPRYLSCTGTVGGTSPSYLIGVQVLLYNAHDTAEAGTFAFNV